MKHLLIIVLALLATPACTVYTNAGVTTDGYGYGYYPTTYRTHSMAFAGGGRYMAAPSYQYRGGYGRMAGGNINLNPNVRNGRYR